MGGSVDMNRVLDKDHVVLECIKGTSMYTVRSTLSTEQFLLPAGRWDIEYDGTDSIVFCLDEDSDGGDDIMMTEPMLVDECLKYRVSRGPGCDGAQRVEMVHRVSGKTIDISVLQRTRQLKGVLLNCGSLTKTKFDVAILSWPRAGCLILWSLESVYAKLDLKMYNGKAGVWLSHSFRSFCELLDKMNITSSLHMLLIMDMHGWFLCPLSITIQHHRPT